MNAKKYIEVLSSRLKLQIHEWLGDNPCLFQQYSVPCHTGKKVHDWMKKNHFKLPPWPGNSPALNPIESLWDVLRDKIHEVLITNKTQLIERLIRVWFHFQKIKALFVSLINGVRRRVVALSQAKKGQTKY